MPIWRDKGENNEASNAVTIYIEATALDMESNLEYCDGTKRGNKEVWSFSKHCFRIEAKGEDFADQTIKTFTWEVKNMTKSVIIESGTWNYTERLGSLFWKNVETTNDYRGDTIRLTLSVTQQAKKLHVYLCPQTLFV
jgi:hypothetical protein